MPSISATLTTLALLAAAPVQASSHDQRYTRGLPVDPEEKNNDISTLCESWSIDLPKGRQKALLSNKIYFSSLIYVGSLIEIDVKNFSWPTKTAQCVLQASGYLSGLSDTERQSYNITLGEALGWKQ